MQNQKGNIVLIIAGIIAVAILAGGVGYFVAKKPAQKEEQKQETQQQEQQKSISEITEQKIEQPEVIDETANWKTYRNEKYGFEIRYPNDYTIINKQWNGFIIGLQSYERKKRIESGMQFPSGENNIDIYFWDNINKVSFKKGMLSEPIYKDLTDYLNSEFAAITKIGEIKIDGVEISYDVILPGIVGNYGVMIEKNGIFVISFGGVADKNYLQKTDSQILSTFKFIK